VFNKKTELTSSYFYNYIDHALDKTTDRISYFPDKEDIYYHEDNKQQNTNSSHRINITLDHKIDSVNSLKLTSYLTYNQTEVDAESQGESSFEDGTLQNFSDMRTIGSGDAINFNNNLLYRHRFNKKGRTLSGNLLYSINETDNVGQLFQDIIYFKTPTDSLVEIRQRNTQKNSTQNYGVNLSFTEPLGGRKYLETNYSIRMNDSEVNRDVYDLEGANELFNPLLSNRYTSQYLYQRAGANIKFNHKDYTLTIGGA
jgi:hypothetical protein